jgi:formiminotetrahydrofolate cyclodeaminase
LSVAYTSLWNLTATEIKSRVASISPTPGGGSVSVIAASLGLALLHKGTSVSLKKLAADAAKHQSLDELRMKLVATMDSLSRLADEDADAFQSFMKACSLSHTTEDESAARKISMDETLLRATQIPIESAVEMAQGLALAEAAVGLAEANVLSDVFAGALLLHASIKAVLLNVDANISGLQSAELREAMQQKRIALEEEAVFRADAIASSYRLRADIAETL